MLKKLLKQLQAKKENLTIWELQQKADEYIKIDDYTNGIPLCDEIIEYYKFDIDSCHRVGDFSESSRSERYLEVWEEKKKKLQVLKNS